MSEIFDNQFRRLIVVGDRVLVKLDQGAERTERGLILPATVAEKQQVYTGRVVAVGPGVPTASADPDDEEPWRQNTPQPTYIPMQAQVGDVALFLQKASIELRYQGEEFMIVPQGAILILLRDEDEIMIDESGDPPTPLPPPEHPDFD